MFFAIIGDMDSMITQYGPPQRQETEARSRLLTPVFNTIIYRFRELLKNTPESFIEGRIATKGRIEHQFVAFGGITVLFMEVKRFLRTPGQINNVIAQVFSLCLIWCMLSRADGELRW